MKRFIAINLIQIIVWYLILFVRTFKTGNSKHLFFNWLVVSFITFIILYLIYCII